MSDIDTVDTQAQPSAPEQSGSQTAPEIDLDGVSSFKWQGETYTPDRFTEIYQGYQKYGEAQKQLEENQKFEANLDHDIEKVLTNPARLAEFKSVYPPKYHAYVDRLLNQNQRATAAPDQTGQLPKEVLEKLTAHEQRLAQYEQKMFQAEVQAASAKIDAILPSLLKKYELADQDKVLFAAEKILDKGGKLTDATWERLVREEHERVTSRADKFYQAKLKTQITKGQKGSDVGPGGATPGQAPVKPRTFAEAQEAMIQSLRERQGLKT